MPFEVSAAPAPLTFTIRPRFGWQGAVSILWFLVITYLIFNDGESNILLIKLLVWLFLFFGLIWFLSLFRRERIEIYPDEMVWKKTTFGITTLKRTPLEDVRAAQWNESDERSERGPSYIAFYVPGGIVRAGFTLTFEEFNLFREQIHGMYPALYDRWATAGVQSDGLTLLNLG